MIHFDRVILNLRHSGLTYAQIARSVNVSERAIQSWVAGERTPNDYRIVLPLLNLHLDRCPERHCESVIGEP